MTHFLVKVIITALMCLELVDTAVALGAEVAVKGFGGLEGGFGLRGCLEFGLKIGG